MPRRLASIASISILLAFSAPPFPGGGAFLAGQEPPAARKENAGEAGRLLDGFLDVERLEMSLDFPAAAAGARKALEALAAVPPAKRGKARWIGEADLALRRLYSLSARAGDLAGA